MRIHGLPSKLLGLAFTLAAVWACGGGKKSAETNTPIRSGVEIKNVELKYRDFAPDISADGTKILFTSGRDEKALRIYKVSYPAGAPSEVTIAPERVTAGDEELDAEHWARISHDGTKIVLLGVKSGIANLYVRDFAGAGSLLTVTTRTGDSSAETFADVAMHPTNPNLFAYATIDSKPTGPESHVFLAEIGAGVVQTKRLTGPEQLEDQPFFAAASSTLFSRIVRPGSGLVTLIKRDIADFSSVPEPTPTAANLVSGSTKLMAAASSSSILATERAKSSELYTVPGDPNRQSHLISKPVRFGFDGERLSPQVAAAGVRTEIPSSAQSGFLWLTQSAYLCPGDTIVQAGTWPVLLFDGETAATPLIPRSISKDSRFPEAVADPCDRTAVGEPGATVNAAIDSLISFAKLNATATRSAHRVVYVSAATANSETRDPEVLLYERDATIQRWYEVSNNTKTAPLPE